MAKEFIQKFKTIDEYETCESIVLNTPHVVLIENTQTVIYKNHNGSKPPINPEDITNGHEYVDLGLPSGTLWATCNVGAEKENDYGFYFAWASTKPATYDEIATNQVSFGVGGNMVAYEDEESNPTKYNDMDKFNRLELIDDAARIHMGGKWRLPTKEQLEELIEHTDIVWGTIDNINGCRFTNKQDTTKYIFIPAAGFAFDFGTNNVNAYCYLWSSNVNTEDYKYAYYLYFYKGGYTISNDFRFGGFSCRGVLNP